MTLWELAACIDGVNKANGGGEAPGASLTPAEESALWQMVQGG